jgi:hypothetical protein
MPRPTPRDGVTDFRLTIVHDPAVHSWTETLAIGAHPDDVDGLLQIKNPHTGSATADTRINDALGSVMILAPIIGVAVGATDPNSASSYAVLGGTIVDAAAIGAAGFVKTERSRSTAANCGSVSSSRRRIRQASAMPACCSTTPSSSVSRSTRSAS